MIKHKSSERNSIIIGLGADLLPVVNVWGNSVCHVSVNRFSTKFLRMVVDGEIDKIYRNRNRVYYAVSIHGEVINDILNKNGGLDYSCPAGKHKSSKVVTSNH